MAAIILMGSSQPPVGFCKLGDQCHFPMVLAKSIMNESFMLQAASFITVGEDYA